MADQNVLKAQEYLNSMYGHRSEWVKLEENGRTGTATIRGIIRAFQIENGVSVVGEAGPTTLKKFKALPKISKMDPNGSSDNNVCLIQCALFCKGYAAGGITGIYYTSGVNAVTQLQKDANIGATGIIDWKVWSALLSFSWFTEPASPSVSWDPKIRQIQQQLNGAYSDYLNVRACDGVMSRETALSLIGALQAEEGILSPDETLTNLNELNFGEQTTALFPGPLTIGNSKKAFNKIAQYGLYFNGYDPGNFDGTFDSTMLAAVSQFQNFYALTGIINDSSGEIGYQTMMSLLISRGDTARPAKACDCSTVLNEQQAKDLSNAGYEVVGRYLTGTVGGTRSKALTINEIKYITNTGMKIFPIYQDGGTKISYFTNSARGYGDAVTAIQTALRLGFPYGTIIYFAVDFDCLPQQVSDYIVDYFKEINGVFNTTVNSEQYKVGVYGPRQLCQELHNKMLTVSSFVSDMSRGFTGNCGYALPQNWSFDQFYELKFPSSPSFDLDKVALSHSLDRDKGCGTFNAVDPVSDGERMNAVYKKYWNKFATVTQPLDNIYTYNFDFINQRVQLSSYTDLNMRIEVNTYLETKTTLTESDQSTTVYSIPINIDDAGNLSPDFEAKVKEILDKLDSTGLAGQYYDAVCNKCISVAEEMRYGKLTISFKITKVNACEFALAWESNDIDLPADNEGNPSHVLTLHLAWIVEIIKLSDDYILKGQAVLTVSAVALVLAGGWAIAEAGAAGIVIGSVYKVTNDLIAILELLLSAGILATS